GWLINKCSYGRRKVGARAGGLVGSGYRGIAIDTFKFPEHRVIWAWVHEAWPSKAEVDHVNGIRDDNRLENLREAHRHENAQNMSLKRNKCDKALSKYIGVTYQHGPNKPLSKPWKVCMHHQNKHYYFGYYATEEEAHEVYLKKKAELHTFNPVPRD